VDPTGEEPAAAVDRSAADDPIDPFALTRSCLALLGREPLASARVDLVRLSLTVPARFGSVRIVASRYVRESGARGHLLATDRRVDGSEHVYGISIADAARSVDEWCSLTSADPKGCRARVVTGWRDFREDGDPTLLEEHLPRVFGYEAKAWPDGRPRRPADVFASGALAPLWSPLVRLAVPGLRGNAAGTLAGPSRGGETLATTGCAWCGRPMPEGMRVDAVWCRASCRVSGARARARGRP
jgi:hypothetical protein